jgi:hypothetical protein
MHNSTRTYGAFLQNVPCVPSERTVRSPIIVEGVEHERCITIGDGDGAPGCASSGSPATSRQPQYPARSQVRHRVPPGWRCAPRRCLGASRPSGKVSAPGTGRLPERRRPRSPHTLSLGPSPAQPKAEWGRGPATPDFLGAWGRQAPPEVSPPLIPHFLPIY